MSTQHNQPAYPRKVRDKWYFLVDHAGYTVDEVCERYLIPRKTYYKWRAKDADRDHTHIPSKQHPQTKISGEVRQFIERRKKETNYGAHKMSEEVYRVYGISVSSTAVQNFYKKKRLVRNPQKKLPWYEPMREKLNITRPGEGVQLDVKYVYPNGYLQYQFSVFDPYTRLYHFSVFDTRESKNAVTALKRARAYFGFPIRSTQTDNGSEFRGDFHRWCLHHDLPHYFIPKKSPWWNAEVERVHKTIDDEYYCNPYRIWPSAAAWLEYYNSERLHEGIGYVPPREKLAMSVTP